MNIKKLILLLISITLIAFVMGFLSFKYNDKGQLLDYISKNNININSKEGIVDIGGQGINIIDRDNHVYIGWDGINIRSGADHFSIGWRGINIREGGKSLFRFGNRRPLLNFSPNKLTQHSIDEERFEDINNVGNISISSSFVKVKVKSEDRDDIRIHYHGSVKSNILPKLIVNQRSDNLHIKLEGNRSMSQVVSHSDLVLEVFLPPSFEGNLKTATSSGDIEIEDLIGNIFDTSSSSGQVKIKNLQGQLLRSSTSSGDIDINNFTGKTNLASSSGNINLSNQIMGDDIKISTSSGNVRIELPDDPSYRIKGNSSSGRYTSNIDMDVKRNERGSFEATIGQGKQSINIITSSGDVNFN